MNLAWKVRGKDSGGGRLQDDAVVISVEHALLDHVRAVGLHVADGTEGGELGCHALPLVLLGQLVEAAPQGSEKAYVCMPTGLATLAEADGVVKHEHEDCFGCLGDEASPTVCR